ncbi:MAG: GGDEF domain-containing protein [Cyanobium sp.]
MSEVSLLKGRVNRQLWVLVALTGAAGSALMALLAGVLVLSSNANEQLRVARNIQRDLSQGLTSFKPLHDLQRQLQRAVSSETLESAMVVDRRGVVLAASNSALEKLPLQNVLQLPRSQQLQALFVACPSQAGVVSCLNQERHVFLGPLPWLGGDALVMMRPSPLALEGLGRFGDRATLITVTKPSSQRNEALRFVALVFAAGSLPLIMGSLGLLLLVRRQLLPELLNLAQIDALSGIFNRRTFLETAGEVLAKAEKVQLPCSLAVIDVDHFKTINDQNGHEVGDQVIRHVSQFLSGVGRSTDLVGRLGGDEFIILLQNPAEKALMMLDRTRKQLQVSPLRKDEGGVVEVELSVGVASTEGASGYTLEKLMGAADAALYVAKDRGRHQVVCLETEPLEQPGRTT